MNPRLAPVAQLDRALPSEGKGHTFESCRVRHSAILYDIVSDRRANAALGRRRPLTEPLAIADQRHRELIRKAKTNANAALSRAMSWLPRRPIFCPIRLRLMVTGLSAITCDVTRNPFSGLGTMVTRKSGASSNSDLSWQSTTAAWLSGKASVWTMTARRGLPWSAVAATVTTSPRRIGVKFRD